MNSFVSNVAFLLDCMKCLRTLCFAALVPGALLVGCASAPPVPLEDGSAFVMVPVNQTSIRDGRAQFRNVFCAVLEARVAEGYQANACDEHLVRLSDESPRISTPVSLETSQKAITVVFIAGLGSSCVAQTQDARAQFKDYLARFGYDFVTIDVSGISSSAQNARYIRDKLTDMPDTRATGNVIVVAHSKGVVDTLEALTTYPQLRDKIIAVVSLAGAVGGSPLADIAPDTALSIARNTPGLKCKEGDGGALQSLRPRVRRDWLAKNPLPRSVRSYSIVALPSPERISAGLKTSYGILSDFDPRNDGNMLFYDQVIPGSTLLGYANADHWAIATDLGASPYALVRGLADKSDFPREAMIEAALRFVEQDLSTQTAR